MKREIVASESFEQLISRSIYGVQGWVWGGGEGVGGQSLLALRIILYLPEPRELSKYLKVNREGIKLNGISIHVYTYIHIIYSIRFN